MNISELPAWTLIFFIPIIGLILYKIVSAGIPFVICFIYDLIADGNMERNLWILASVFLIIGCIVVMAL
jgi:hypothetical protein